MSGFGGLPSTANLPKLDGKNYQSWRELIDIVLELRDLKSAITNERCDPKTGLQAKLILLESMNESHRAQVRGCTTAKEIVERLQLIYADKSAANLYRMLIQYYRYTKNPSDSMSEHIGKMDEMRNQLADHGEKQSEAVYQVSLIGSLPGEYSSIMEIWELTSQEMRTTPNLVARLLKREEDLGKQTDSSQALLARPRMTREEIEAKKKVTKCGLCSQVGHWRRECPKNPDRAMVAVDNQEPVPNEAQDRDEVIFNVSSSVGELKNKWVSDSGASAHMCNNKDWFETIAKPEQRRFVSVGDGQRVEVLGVGSIKIESWAEGRWLTSTLKEVLFVPGLSTNLFSIGAAASKGIHTTFDDKECKMRLNDKLVASGAKLTTMLYLMRFRVISKPNMTGKALLTVEKTMDSYHRRLGHANVGKIKVLLKDLNLKVPSDETVNCEACPSGKGRHPSHPSFGVRAQEPGHLHVDLSGIVNKVSLGGFRYYMLCTDEFTGFDLAYLCKSKAEVPELLARLIIDFEVLSGQPVLTIMSDNGSEFCNRTTELLCLKEKVKHVTSAPFCPQQNGRIEREMQTITNMARTILLASELPKELWPEAIATAVYLKDRLPNSASYVTPYERLLNQKPTIEHIVEFGTRCHVIVNDRYLNKWDARTVEGFIVGHTPRRNTYRVYVPSKQRVVETCDVILGRHKCAEEEGKPIEGNSGVEVIVNQSRNPIDPTSNEQDDAEQLAPLEEAADVTPHRVDQDSAADGTTLFQTPMHTRTQCFESTPQPGQKTLCTGARLDEFFQTYSQ